MAYDQKAIDFVYSFYSRGLSKSKALPEIQKVYPGFSGSTWDSWESSYDWKQRRALADARRREFDDRVADLLPNLMMQLDEARQRLYTTIQSEKATTQDFYAFSQICDRIASLAKTWQQGRDPERISTRVVGEVVEFMIGELREVPGLGKAIQSNASAVSAIAAAAAERFGQ